MKKVEKRDMELERKIIGYALSYNFIYNYFYPKKMINSKYHKSLINLFKAADCLREAQNTEEEQKAENRILMCSSKYIKTLNPDYNYDKNFVLDIALQKLHNAVNSLNNL